MVESKRFTDQKSENWFISQKAQLGPQLGKPGGEQFADTLTPHCKRHPLLLPLAPLLHLQA